MKNAKENPQVLALNSKVDIKTIELFTIQAWLKPITRWQILDSSKLKMFADDNFKFDENGRKFSKRVENTVGKGEIARYELVTPLWDRPKFKEIADDNCNVAIKGF